VDNSFAQGIGKRLDGWPNRDLDVGGIVALSPALDDATRAVFKSWGRGRYDPRFNLDGKNGPQEIPPAYGLQDVHSITVTGDGTDVQYWNRYVAVTQMGGHGSFSEPRTGVSVTNGTDDLVSRSCPRCRPTSSRFLPPRLPRAASTLWLPPGGSRSSTGPAPPVTADPSSRTRTPASIRSVIRWVSRSRPAFPATPHGARPRCTEPRR